MKRFLFLTAVVLIALSFSVGANAWTGIYGARVSGDRDATIDLSSFFTTAPGATGMVANSGAASSAAGAPNNWGLYLSANVPVVGVRSATYAITLPTTGYYQTFSTWAADTSAKTNAKHIVTSAGGVQTIVYLDQTLASANKNKWNSLGVYKYNASDAANTKVTLTNDNQSTSGSLYMHSLKYESATPGAVTNGGPVQGSTVAIGGNVLSWTAGLYNSFFDVYFGTTSGSLSLLAGGLTSDMLEADLEGMLTAGQQYFWRVDAKNLDLTTAGSEGMFFTEAAVVPEPGSLLALGTGLIGLLGIIRRKKA